MTLGGIVAPMAIECRRNCKDSSAAVRINSAFCRSMNWKIKNGLSAKESRSDEFIEDAPASQLVAFARCGS